MLLTRLSLVSAKRRVPPVLTNKERAIALRMAIEAPTHNAHPWPHLQGRCYEREQSPAPVLNFTDRRGF
jgi:hypothetical protein